MFIALTISSEDAGLKDIVMVVWAIIISVQSLHLLTVIFLKVRRLLKDSCKFRILSRTFEWHSGAASNDSLKERFVFEQMSLLRLENFRSLVVYAQYVLFFTVAPSWYNLWAGRARWMTAGQDAVVSISYLGVLVLSIKPGILTVRTMDLWHSLLMICLAWFMLTTHTDQMYALVGTCMGIQLLLSGANLRFKYYFFWNVVICVVLLLRSGAAPYVFRTRIGIISFAVALILTLRSAELHMEQQVRHRADAIETHNSQCAARAVLSTVCDVVVELDVNLELVEHSPRLADILMLAPDRNLKGSQLQAFMAQKKDEDLFVTHMTCRSKTDEDSMASTFHLQMRDSDHNLIPMECFSVQFECLDKQVRYMIGIREWADGGAVAPLPVTAFRSQVEPARSSITHESFYFPGNGTPATAVKHELTSDALSSPISETLTSESGGTAPLVLGRRLTSGAAKRQTLMLALCGWNVLAPRRYCCEYHAVVLESLKIVLQLHEGACNQDFRLDPTAQCGKCGIMDASIYDASAKTCQLCDLMSRAHVSRHGMDRASL